MGWYRFRSGLAYQGVEQIHSISPIWMKNKVFVHLDRTDAGLPQLWLMDLKTLFPALCRPHAIDSGAATFLYTPKSFIAEIVYTDGKLMFASRTIGEETRLAETYMSFRPLPWLKSPAQLGFLHLPSGPEPYGSVDELATSMRSFITRYFDCEPEMASDPIWLFS